MDTPYSLLFVCMGNICRSPTAHAVMRARVEQAGLQHRIAVDSAGTHNHHPGAPPDRRSQRAAARRGYDLSGLRARQVRAQDFVDHDLILAMDWDNLAMLQARCPAEHAGKLRRLAEFCTQHQVEVVPDPYYGGADGFAEVLDLIEDASSGLLQRLRAELGSRR